jgi:HK97 family phage major capsid protein
VVLIPFNNIISRADALPLIPDETVQEVVKAAAAESAALSLFRRVNMGTKLSTLPVLSALAQAYFVNGDTGLKQTTEMARQGVTLEAEELAAFVPVPEAVVDDTEFDLWGEVQAGLAEAVGIALDAAVFSGTNKPASWPEAIVPAAIAAGNTNVADSTPEQGGAANDVAETFDDVEDDGYDVTAIAAARSLRGMLRKARDTSGQKLVDVQSGGGLDAPITYVANGVLPATTLAVVGDYTMAVLGLRQDMRYKLLDQAVITDDQGAVIYNLPQQDMLALRVTFRAAFAVANPITRPVAGAGTPYPFGVLTSA